MADRRFPLVPPRVRPGDTAAVVCPSFGAVEAWPRRAEQGARYLESLGLRVEFMASARGPAPVGRPWVSASPEERAADLHTAFADPDVSVVLWGIGGEHSAELLPLLDFDLIRAHPKVFHGFSDATVLQWAVMARTGLRTFYGPALVTGLAEVPAPFAYTDRALRAAWFGDGPLALEPADGWTDEFQRWEDGEDLRAPRRLRPSAGWRRVRDGRAEGPLLGGCLESICLHLKGSADWLDLEGAVLLLETSEEAPPPEKVDAYLIDLENLGVLDAVAALLVARPGFYPAEDVEDFWRVVHDRTRRAGTPVLGDIEAGHFDPMMTLPLGAPVRLDVAAGELRTLEPPTAPR